ncbi:MAG: hypothetical protein ACOH1P_02290 [Lysobacter sp.]
MSQLLKSLMVGVVSGVLTYVVSVRLIGYPVAIAMPRGFPLARWDAVVVFGLGAALVALLIHFLAIRVLAARIFPALLGFAATVVLALAVAGLLTDGGNAIAAWLIGALLASAALALWVFRNSSKSKPLRESA